MNNIAFSIDARYITDIFFITADYIFSLQPLIIDTALFLSPPRHYRFFADAAFVSPLSSLSTAAFISAALMEAPPLSLTPALSFSSSMKVFAASAARRAAAAIEPVHSFFADTLITPYITFIF